MPRIIIGLVGPIAAGKSTTVDYLKSLGFVSYSLSDRIREELISRNLMITRENLNHVSNELRKTLGPDVLAKKTAALVEKNDSEKVVIDSIRNPQEVAFLKDQFGVKIIGIIAPQEKRFDFFASRGTNNAGIETWEEFKKLDDMEYAQTGEHKQQVKACLALSDYIIENAGTVEDLQKKIDNFISRL